MGYNLYNPLKQGRVRYNPIGPVPLHMPHHTCLRESSVACGQRRPSSPIGPAAAASGTEPSKLWVAFFDPQRNIYPKKDILA